MAGRTLYDIEDVSNLGISNENVSDISFCDCAHMQVMWIPVSITANHDRLQLTDLKLFSWAKEQGEILQFRILNLKQLYLQVLIGWLCWLHIQREGMLGVVFDVCLVIWHPTYVLLMAYPVQKFFHIALGEGVQE
jgi:hypothetical protein